MGVWSKPIALPFHTSQAILACGAESKNTVCVVKDGKAFLSENIGDLEQIEHFQRFQEIIASVPERFGITPAIIAHDLHPEYLSTKYAKQIANPPMVRLMGIQHHHAHIAACMADHDIHQPVIGVAFDGSGYGTDGHFWGGEFFIADYADFQRVAHLQYIPMPGGGAAIKEPWRMAFAFLDRIYGDQLPQLPIAFLKQIDPRQQAIVRTMIRQKFHAPLTSSIGRLFDAVSALLGICGFASYEGQAAIELQQTAERAPQPEKSYDYNILEQPEPPYYLIQPEPLFIQIIEALKNNVPNAVLAARFHATVAEMMVNICRRLRQRFQLQQVALAGGVFQNRLLRELAVQQLQQDRFEVLLPRTIPLHDGNIAFGQAVIAAANYTDNR